VALSPTNLTPVGIYMLIVLVMIPAFRFVQLFSVQYNPCRRVSRLSSIVYVITVDVAALLVVGGGGSSIGPIQECGLPNGGWRTIGFLVG
jgi:hypothetical protein